MQYRKELESLITQVLNERGLSDREAGRAAGLHHSTVGALRNGEVHARQTLVKFARAFDIPQKTIFEAAGLIGEQITRQALMEELKDISARLARLASLILEAE